VVASVSLDDLAVLHERVLSWYAGHARPLPWRDPSCSAWGVFVSEVMAQQTPLSRVEGPWREWIARWPTPADLAAAPPGDVLRAWGRLGYPRRALRLHEAARVMLDRHGGQVPSEEEALLALPGVGPYTAAAVAAFAFGRRTVVVDTNVRRVLARVVTGRAQAAPALTRAERDLAAALLPSPEPAAATWNVAVMELGALVCSSRAPLCETCPLSDRCAWTRAGRPAYDGPARRGQSWEGTDRQVRGRILAALREATSVSRGDLDAAASGAAQVDRCLDSLVGDGLVEPLGGGRFALPGMAEALP
jgi:A/G-specific adenine glycosylase